jgi:hypothetical protein
MTRSSHENLKPLTCVFLMIVLICLVVFHNTTPRYDRDLFGGWSDIDRDCQNTRHELLQERSARVVTLSEDGCRVLQGEWVDLYTGQTFRNSSQLDIDHLVPLKYGWDRGAYRWPSYKRVKFTNDPANLFAVQKSVNRQKSASGPLEWLPPDNAYRCQYIRNFQGIVGLYELKQTVVEQQMIKLEERRYCN